MDQKLLDFLQSERVGVLAVEQLDGSPHAATVHFAHTEDPFVLYFETNKNSKKAQKIMTQKYVSASFVVGTSESVMKTAQLDGKIRLITPQEQSTHETVYLGKFPEKKEKLTNADIIRLVFIPTWWRFSDFTGDKQKISSEDYQFA